MRANIELLRNGKASIREDAPELMLGSISCDAAASLERGDVVYPMHAAGYKSKD